MLVYVVVFGLATILASVAEYGRKARNISALPRKWTLAAILVVVLLAGASALRWRVGTDYANYEWLFPIYAKEVVQSLSLLGEPGLRVIARVSMVISGDSAMMFAIAAIVTIGLTVRTLWRWSPAFAFSIAVYVLSGAWHGSFNGIRQYLACAILFAGHRYIVDRRFGRWLLVVLVAMLFHVSAVVALLMYFVPTKRTSFGVQAAVFALGLAVMLSSGSLLEFLALQTGDSEFAEGSYANRSINPLRVAFAFLPIALYWLLRNREAIAESRAWFYVNMLAIYAATYLASANSALLARFAIYALPFVAIGLASVTSVPDTKERALIRGILLCLFAAFMFLEISATSNLMNFQWIFQRG